MQANPEGLWNRVSANNDEQKPLQIMGGLRNAIANAGEVTRRRIWNGFWVSMPVADEQ